MIGVPMNIISIVLAAIIMLVHVILFFKFKKNKFIRNSMIMWSILIVLEISLFNFRF